MFSFKKRIRIKGGDTEVERYLTSTSIVWCERLQPWEALNFTHCVLKEIPYSD